MRLSIITVCKNADSAIEKTILSVINQSFTDYEYIIVDGVSNDGTMDIIRKYSDKINKVISEPDEGIYDAMNKGIDISTGEYIMFLNAGDYFVNNAILNQIFNQTLYGDIIYGNGLIEFSNGFVFRKTFPKKITRLFMFMDTIPHQDSLTKRESFQKTNGFDKNYIIAGDYDFFLKSLYKINLSTQYIPLAMVVNDLTGLSNQDKFKIISKNERKTAAKKYFSKNLFFLFSIIKPFYFLFVKYPKYILNLFYSVFNKKSILIEKL